MMRLLVFALPLVVGGAIGLRVCLAILCHLVPQYRPLARTFDAIIVAVASFLLRLAVSSLLVGLTLLLYVLMATEMALRGMLRGGHVVARRIGGVPLLPVPGNLGLPAVSFAERAIGAYHEATLMAAKPMGAKLP